MDIKSMLEADGYPIVPDKCVLLHVYGYSSEFSQFALACLRAVEDHVVLPATVSLEYHSRRRQEFSRMERRVKSAGEVVRRQAEGFRRKVLAACDQLARLQHPEVDQLRGDIEGALDEVVLSVNRFFADRPALDLTSRSWEERTSF